MIPSERGRRQRHADALDYAIRDLEEAAIEDRPWAVRQVQYFAERSPFASVREAALKAMAANAP